MPFGKDARTITIMVPTGDGMRGRETSADVGRMDDRGIEAGHAGQAASSMEEDGQERWV